jgi:Zinc finger, C3HC4 type (RING finger)
MENSYIEEEENNDNDSFQSDYDADQCQICFEDIEIYVITACNHNMICHQCHWKMRVKENTKCTMCKAENDAIVLSMNPDLLYENLDLRKMNVSEKGQMYFLDDEVE